MRKAAIASAAVVALALGAIVVSIANGADKVTQPMRVHVIEHATTDKVIDTGKAGDTTGDLLTWHNALFDATDSTRVGHDQGECVRMSPKQGTWECRWINWVEGGAITVEGVFFDTKNSVLAITGGTGMYRNARGTMTLKFHGAAGEEFDFIFNVLP